MLWLLALALTPACEPSTSKPAGAAESDTGAAPGDSAAPDTDREAADSGDAGGRGDAGGSEPGPDSGGGGKDTARVHTGAGETGAPDLDGDGWSEGEDCDDSRDDIWPGAEELCDGEDQDCDEVIDEEAVDLLVMYRDADEDGYGHAEKSVSGCELLEGYSLAGGDCDDGEPAINPGVGDADGDGEDEDCDGLTDEGAAWISDVELALFADYSEDELRGVGAGDVDGDGLSDLLLAHAFPLDSEAAGLYLGPVTGAVTCCEEGAAATLSATAVTTGSASFSGAGWDLARDPGDVDGDGFDDLLLNARGYSDESGETVGLGVFLLAGGALSGELNLPADATAAIYGDEEALAFAALTLAGDLDGDGDDELLIGSGELAGTGGAYLIAGPVSGTLALEDAPLLSGESADSDAGYACAAAGDIDGDGLDDLLVGAQRQTGADPEAGAAYLIPGPVTGDVALADAEAVIRGATRRERLGNDLSGLADIDGDGYNDLGVDGAGLLLFSGPVSGALGPTDAVATIDFAGALAGAGDVNGDGLADLLVGASSRTNIDFAEGSAFLLLSPLEGSIGEDAAHRAFHGSSDYAYLGDTVRAAGDTDGDGALEGLISSAQESAWLVPLW